MTKVFSAIKARETDAPHLLAGAEVEKYEMPNPTVYRNQSELYRMLPDIGIAVEMLMNVGALVKANVVTRGGDEEEKEVLNHDFEKLLQSPNPLQSGVEFMQDTIGFRTLNRNCYWWLNRTSPTAPPDELWIIPPDKILPIPDERLYLKGYRYDPYGNASATADYGIFLETWEVEHFKGFNPFNRFVGLSLIEALAVAAMGSVEARKWNTRLFGKNNARMPGILAFKDYVNDTDWDRLKYEVVDAAEKRQNLMLRGVGDGGVTWTQASSNMRDMEFLGGLQDTRRLIWDFIAPGLSSMLDPSSTEASSKTGETVFRNYAIWPVMKYIESRINRRDRTLQNPGLMQAYGDKFYLCVEDFRITDKVMELKEIDTFAQFHTVDEVRKEKFADKPIGDERGALLVAEIKAAPAFGETSDPQANNADAVEEPTAKADYTADLIKWREKAVKRGAGVLVDYESDVIPENVYRAVINGLRGCKSKHDIKILFQRHIHEAKPKAAVDDMRTIRAMLETAMTIYKE